MANRPKGGPAALPAERPPVPVTAEVLRGDITLEKTPVAVIGRLEGMPVGGADHQFDQRLFGWLSRGVELGAIGSRLGQLFFVPAPPGLLEAELLVLAGMGEPGRFGRDELRLLMTNVATAVAALGRTEFCTLLIGAGRGGLAVRQALTGMLEGVADGLQRLPEGVQASGLKVTIVERDEDRAGEVQKALEGVAGAFAERGFTVGPMRSRPAGPPPAAAPASTRDVEPPVEMNRVTVTMTLPAETPPGEQEGLTPRFVKLQYTALGRGAVMPVREQEVQEYFAWRIPATLSRPAKADVQSRYGRMLGSYLVPEDVQQIMFDGPPLTLVVDRRTAAFPWEMAAAERDREGSFLGVSPGVSRQFRTLAAAGQAVAPPRNNTLNVLILADPAGGRYQLPEAAKEGLAVAAVMQKVRESWKGWLKLTVTLRVGPAGDTADARAVREMAREAAGVEDAAPCDPMEVLSLIAGGQYDVIHFAGHGVTSGGRSGWVFGPDCVFSASELMRSRRVPRLVFANACHSGHLGEDRRERQLSEQASLAEAFFLRGVHNYIGAGWQVDDAAARRLAVAFYTHALTGEKAPPAVIGQALRDARRDLLRSEGGDDRDTTWGAYQHYGPWNDKLLPLRNEERPAGQK